jgi:septal ring factor EnvC (AmiA/AmiB activator)
MSLDARLAESSRQCDILRAELNAANATSQGKDDCIAELRAELEAVKQERDSARAQLLEAAETERFLQAELKLKSTPKK